MKTAKPSAPAIGRRLRRTLGALLSIGFATTWWKFVPPHESVANAAPPPTTPAHEEPAQVRIVVVPIPVVLPFALPTAPRFAPPPQRHRPHSVHTQVAVVAPHRPFALPPPDYVVPPVPEVVEEPPAIVEEPPPVVEEPPVVKQPPVKLPEPRIRTRSS